jgi:polysaccharide biosynthesis transport protein
MSVMQNKGPAAPMSDIVSEIEGMGGAQAPSMDVLAILRGVRRRWKFVAAITLCVSIATYGIVKLIVPSRYKSTVEILVYDPQQQIDATVQKPISPFVDALGNDAINTEINILKSKSVALRVASELDLDTDPDFQPQSHGLRIGDLAKWLGIVANRVGIPDLAERFGIADLAERLKIADLAERFGFAGLGRADDNSEQTASATEEKAEKLDRAADELIKRVDVSQDSYIISVSATSRDPIKAQRLAATIANDYLASQREARQEALDHVAAWLKGHIDNLQSRVVETEASIEKLKVETGFRDSETERVKEQQIRDLNVQLVIAREEVNDKRARFEQAHHVLEANGDIGAIPGVQPTLQDPAGVRTTLSELRRKQMELNWSLADLQNKLGGQNPQVLSARAALAIVNKQMDAEREHILSNMKNDYDISAQREQMLEANLQSLAANLNSETYIRLQQLRHAADSDRKDYETYLAQYNNIAEQREMQSASARIISPASLPRSANSNRVKFYALGGLVGLGGGSLLAFLLEYFKPGVKTSMEIEQSFGLPVVGFVPLASQRKTRRASYLQSLDRVVNEPFSHLSQAVRSMRIHLQLSNPESKVILITSALPGEGKSTVAMLLAASCTSSGKKTILLDCDLRLRSTSDVLRQKQQPGLSEFLCCTATLADVITQDPITKINLIPAGSTKPNAGDLMMSQGMLDLIAVLRSGFDYIIMDTPPLLPVVDALALAAGADKILLVVEWGRTSHAILCEAFRVLGPEAHRVAGVVLNKVDFDELPGYGGYRKYFDIA